MASRQEVLKEIKEGIETTGIFPLHMRARSMALSTHNRERRGYEKSREDLLTYELALYYRVAVFGSARIDKDNPEYSFVTRLTKSLVEARDVDIVTGGGPGAMEAANYGARLAIDSAGLGGRRPRSRNLGESIIVPHEQKSNDHLDYNRIHPEFSTRLQAFLDSTHAAYNAEGGVGTLFEMLMLVQAKQVGHLEPTYPIIAHPFWKPIVTAWNDTMYHEREANGLTRLINEKDLELITFSNKIPEIVDVVSRDYDRWRKEIRDHVRVIWPRR